MLDNGAFSAWKRGHAPDWPAYYAWCDRWLDRSTTWAVIPDVIDGGSQLHDAMMREWPHGHRGAPVWHMDEPVARLLRLVDEWPRVCIGSTAEYRVVGSDAWRARMDDVFGQLARRHRRTPWLHMLRGMQCSRWGWPFASLDSTDVAQNHGRGGRSAKDRAMTWDSRQCPATWAGPQPVQLDMLEVA